MQKKQEGRANYHVAIKPQMKKKQSKKLTGEKKLVLKNLKSIADSIVKTFGRNCEAAVHDLTNLQKSLIYIAGTITKRKPGAPITDLIVKALRKEGNDISDMHNYRTSLVDGRAIKSSTSFARNSNGEVIGALCINFDVTEYLNSLSLIGNFVGLDSNNKQTKTETFATSASETITSIFEEGVSQIGRQPSTMTVTEKIQLVEILEHKGAFMIKGAVDQIALAMGISKFSIYNYLKKIRLLSEKSMV